MSVCKCAPDNAYVRVRVRVSLRTYVRVNERMSLHILELESGTGMGQ